MLTFYVMFKFAKIWCWSKSKTKESYPCV